MGVYQNLKMIFKRYLYIGPYRIFWKLTKENRNETIAADTTNKVNGTQENVNTIILISYVNYFRIYSLH